MSSVGRSGGHRIGEFSRRVGVTPEVLRAWERRYGLLQPFRSPGGFRLYSAEDADRVARMRQALDDGLSAAEAARVALTEDAAPAVLAPTDLTARLFDAIERYDEDGIQAILDESLAAFSVEAVLRDLVLPTLHRVGDAWANGALDISQEHFASNVIRSRLMGLARLWGRGAGPLALLACVPGEAHDITLVSFGLALRSHGWRILFLGADTPIETVAQTAETTGPTVAVLASFDAGRIRAQQSALRQLAAVVPLWLAGPGASKRVCAELGIDRLNGDLLAAAEVLTTNAR
jgi:MerR family transcriptional regulator, light-induced transcriptional regulator